MRNHILATIDEIIVLLEAEIPGNQNSPKNQKLKRRLERDLAKYFRSLEDAFPYGKLAAIYNRNVKESLGSDTWTDGLMKTFPPDYRAALMDCGRLGGYEFDVIRKIHAEMGIPILLHSTEDRLPVINEIRKAGVTEFLRKPFGMGNLVKKLTEILFLASSALAVSNTRKRSGAPYTVS